MLGRILRSVNAIEYSCQQSDRHLYVWNVHNVKATCRTLCGAAGNVFQGNGRVVQRLGQLCLQGDVAFQDAHSYFLAFSCAHVAGVSWDIPASAIPRMAVLRHQLDLPECAEKSKSLGLHDNRLVTVGRWTFPNSALRTLAAFKRLGPHGYLSGTYGTWLVPAHVAAQRHADEFYQTESGYITSYFAEFAVTSMFRLGIGFNLWYDPDDADMLDLDICLQCGEQDSDPDAYNIDMDGLVLEPSVVGTSAAGLQKGRISYDGGFDCGGLRTGARLQAEPIMALADGGQDLHVDAILAFKGAFEGRPISFESARWDAINPRLGLDDGAGGLSTSLQAWLNGPPEQATIADFGF